MSKRFFLDSDNSSHWYIVPCNIIEEWNKWRNLSEDDPKAWVVPDSAIRLNKHIKWVTFTNPIIK